jgi:integrase
MGTIYQRRTGGTYYGYWTDQKGRHKRKSLRTRDPQVARARLRQLELVSTDPAAHSRHTLGEAIGNLLAVVSHGNAAATWGSYRQKGENVLDGLGNVELSEISREIVLAYVRARKAKGASDGTIHKELVVLRRALVEAGKRGLWKGNPRDVVPSIRIQYQPRERWLTARDGARLLGELGGDRKLWAALAMLAGLRLSEVEAIRWEHVDLDARRLRAPGKKTPSAWRIVPIGPDLERLLRAAKKRMKPRPSDRIVRKWPNVRRDLAAAIERINTKDAEAAAKRKRQPGAKLTKVTPNDLRRTFASWLKQQGMDSLVVARLLGHTSTRMVEKVYGHLSDANYAEAIGALPRLKLAG